MNWHRFFVAALLLASASALRAATFNISDNNPAGLKAAIVQSNTNNQDDTINLAPGGQYVLSTVDNTDGGANGLPVLAQDGSGSGHTLTINGNGATIARSTVAGTPDFRIMRIYNFGTAYTTISRVIFANGSANGPAHTSGDSGGGVSVNAYVVMDGCTFRDNYALSSGGAVEKIARLLTLRNCTFIGNDAGGEATVLINENEFLGLENCTVVGQSSFGDLLNIGLFGGADLRITNCTLLNANVRNYNNPYITETTLGNTILANSHLYRQFNGTFEKFTTMGYNLSTSDGEGFLIAASDQINADPKLDALGPLDHGGPSPTIALTAGSAALDRGQAMGVTTDQRGFPRPVDNPNLPNASGGDGSDVGAFESSTDIRQAGSTLVVNTNADHDDGECGTIDCSLRDAIARTNALPGANTITFAPAVTGTITLQSAAGGTLFITDQTTITGPGARVLGVSGNNAVRVFQFSFGSNSSNLSGLTISSGRAKAVGRPGASGLGGGILNQASFVSVSDCAFTGNQALGSAGFFAGEAGGSGNGGAVANQGFVVLQRCTFQGNAAIGAAGAANPESGNVITTGGAGGAARGGAVYSLNASVNIYNCTFNGNTATGGAGGSGHFGGAGGAARGGAIHDAGQMSIYGATVSGNTGVPGPGGAGNSNFNNGSPGLAIGGMEAAGSDNPLMQSSIVAANSGGNGGGPDVQGTFNSDGYNLIGNGDFATGFTQIGDQVGTSAALLNPKLGPLQNNGGPTDTMALLTGSTAIDQGKTNPFALTDQRGIARPHDEPSIANASGGDGTDIGAFESVIALVVTTLNDHDDGTCTPSDCTLREAINFANTVGGTQVITFRADLAGTMQLAAALPTVSSDLTINGPGKDVVTLRRNTGGNYRIFTISNGTPSGPLVVIAGLTITNGRAPNAAFPNNSGGGIFNDRGTLSLSDCAVINNASDTTSTGFGGGLLNFEAYATIDRCSFANNTARNGGGAANFRNQATNNQGYLTIRNSTFSGNQATTGGGLYNVGEGAGVELRLTNSTISGNTASGGLGGGVDNAGINSGGAATAYLNDCTFTANSAASDGGGLYNISSAGGATQVYLQNNIFKTGANAPNVTNIGGTITSNGYNLTNDQSGFTSSTGDKRNMDPMLGALADNGGPTQTHALLAGSPAIDAGGGIVLSPLDQRGFFYVGTNDIGAYEYNGIELRIISITRSGNNIIVTFNGAAQRTFRLERRTDLSLGTWESIAGVSDLTPTSNGPAQITDPGAIPLGHAFYRLRYIPAF